MAVARRLGAGPARAQCPPPVAATPGRRPPAPLEGCVTPAHESGRQTLWPTFTSILLIVNTFPTVHCKCQYSNRQQRDVTAPGPARGPARDWAGFGPEIGTLTL